VYFGGDVIYPAKVKVDVDYAKVVATPVFVHFVVAKPVVVHFVAKPLVPVKYRRRPIMMIGLPFDPARLQCASSCLVSFYHSTYTCIHHKPTFHRL
jgi:hypothetical protein